MNRNELEKKLLDENIPRAAYSLTDEFPYDAYCLHYNEKGRVWEVYYGERGNKVSLKYFRTEDEACDYFYSWLIESLKHEGII